MDSDALTQLATASDAQSQSLLDSIKLDLNSLKSQVRAAEGFPSLDSQQ